MPTAAPLSSRYHGPWWDDLNSQLDIFVGTGQAADPVQVASFERTAIALRETVTMSDGVEVTTSPIGLADNISLELGTDDDSVLRHRTATLAANTALTDVLVGTPVAQALAANSTMLSNVTADGDVAGYVNNGGNSEQFLFADASAKVLYAGQTGWAMNLLNGMVKLTLGTVSAFATTQPTNTLVLREGTAPAGAITTAVGLFSSATVMRKIIADGTASNVET